MTKGNQLAIDDPEVLVIRDLKTLKNYYFNHCDKRKALVTSYAMAIGKPKLLTHVRWKREQEALVPDDRQRLHNMVVINDPKPDTRPKAEPKRTSKAEFESITNPIERARVMNEWYGETSII